MAALLAERASTAPDEDSRTSADRLRHHVDEFLIPRALDLTSPLVVVLLGSTGAGKSSLFNTLSGKSLSKTGVVRPTTMTAVAVTSPRDSLPAGLTTLRSEGLVEIVVDEAARTGLAVVDSPDFDSVETGNRTLARTLLETADLLIFVTTDTRYADDVPWQVLLRARERGVPIVAVMNRLPLDDEDAHAVLTDFKRLIAENGLADQGPAGALDVITVPRDALDPVISGLDADAARPVLTVLDKLMESDQARKELAAKSMTAAVEGLADPTSRIIADLEREGEAAVHLMKVAAEAYERARSDIEGHIDRGSFLRAEVLREWQEFVGANRVTRVISEGIGRVAASIRSVFDPGPEARPNEVRTSALEDLAALVVSRSDEAAASAAEKWNDRDLGRLALETDAHLWGSTPSLMDQVKTNLESWATTIAAEINEMGHNRKGIAKVASLGVNVVGTGAIIAVFAHTGGLTGAEAGIAAVTAVLNQALLEAIFGEGNVAAFIKRSRARLDEVIDSVLRSELDRFREALAVGPENLELATKLRESVVDLDRAPTA